jgi:hypothetical protein
MTMASKTAWALCIVTAVIVGQIWRQQVSLAQVNSAEPSATQLQIEAGPAPGTLAATTRAQNDRYGPPRVVTNFYGNERPYVGPEQTAAMRQATAGIHKAAEALRDAEDEESKAKAQDKLTKLLERYFNQDLQRREDELAKIEARTKKLRELLERRRSKKQEIIDLQIKVLSNEAEGLGFFNDPLAQGATSSLRRVWEPRATTPIRNYPQESNPFADPASPVVPHPADPTSPPLQEDDHSHLPSSDSQPEAAPSSGAIRP